MAIDRQRFNLNVPVAALWFDGRCGSFRIHGDDESEKSEAVLFYSLSLSRLDDNSPWPSVQQAPVLLFHSYVIIIIFFYFSSFAESLTRSQFPVYTIYAQKICLSRAGELCGQRPWAYEVVPGFQMSLYVRERRRAATRRACMELCLNERAFQCRYSIIYIIKTESNVFLLVHTHPPLPKSRYPVRAFLQ